MDSLAGYLAPFAQLALLLALAVTTTEVQRWIDSLDRRGERGAFVSVLRATSLVAMIVSLSALVAWAIILSWVVALTGFLLRLAAIHAYTVASRSLFARLGPALSLPGIAGFWLTWTLTFLLAVSILQSLP